MRFPCLKFWIFRGGKTPEHVTPSWATHSSAPLPQACSLLCMVRLDAASRFFVAMVFMGVTKQVSLALGWVEATAPFQPSGSSCTYNFTPLSRGRNPAQPRQNLALTADKVKYMFSSAFEHPCINDPLTGWNTSLAVILANVCLKNATNLKGFAGSKLPV